MRINIIEEIKKTILNVITQLDLPKSSIEIEHPSDETHGDFSSNIAMQLFGELKKSGDDKYKSPRDLAEAIKKEISKLIETNKSTFIKKIEIAGPGFINFYISQNWMLSELENIHKKSDKYGHNNILENEKIIVEYTDPNPFKEFHIGHLYSNSMGESIATILEANGAEVHRADFFGDVGMHVAKSIWGLLEKLDTDSLNIKDLEKWDLKKRIEYFGQAYAKGATAYKKNEPAQEDMKQLNFLIFKAAQEIVLPKHNKNPEVDYDKYIKPSKYSYENIKEIYNQGRAWSLEYFETMYDRLGTKFDGYYPESLTGEYGYNMILDGLTKDIFEKGEGGAIIFPGEKFGLHNRVFINSLGLPTYESKDFGLLKAKYAKYKYTKSIIVTGNEIDAYFQVVLEAMKQYQPDLGNITHHISHGMVRLPEGKMSSRTGKILKGEWLLDEAKKSTLKILEDNQNFTNEKKEEISEQVAIAAVKYALLKQSIGEDIAFDFEKSISFSGNSGPYLQYTFARAMSVLRKSEDPIDDEQNISTNPEELSILRWLYRFPEVVSDAGESYSPHLIATYLYELAQRFNSFYNKHSILQATENKQFRLNMTKAVAIIIENGLKLLGIKAPEKM